MATINQIKIGGAIYDLPSGGSGAVSSVNGKTGAVVLTTSDLQNDSGFITASVANLVNYYTKSETYTQAEVDALIGAISTMSFLVVQTLPTTNIKTNIIYLVPKSPSGTQNTYTEYINTTGTTSGWEKIGDTEIDLSNYYTKTEADTLLANKVDKVSGKGLSTNDYTTTEKTKLAGIASGAEVNVQSDWNVTDSNSDAFIKNKPTIPDVSTKYDTGDTAETNLADGDYFPFYDASATAKRRTLWSNIKAKLKTYFDGIYATISSLATVAFSGSYNDLSDTPAIPYIGTKYDFTDTIESTLDDNDRVPFYDASATGRRNSTWANIKAKLKTYFDALYVTQISGKGLSTNDYTTTEKNKLAGIASGAEVNQLAYSKVKIGEMEISANSETETLELIAGTNITLTGNSSNHSVTVNASTGGSPVWGLIGGTLSNQTDLQSELNKKQNKYSEYHSVDPTSTRYNTYHVSIYSGYIEIASPGSGGGADVLTINGSTKLGIAPTVLWTNPSPTASFTAQAVTLSQALSNFSFYSVIVRASASEDYYMTSGLMPIDKTGRITMALGRNYVRNVATQIGSETVGTSFRIGACNRYTTYGSSTTTAQNDNLIPYQIIGWK